MKRLFWLASALLIASAALAQDIEKVQPAASVRSDLLTVPLGVAREFKLSVRDFATFRDPQWSVLTLAQIGAATADAVTSLNNFNRCGDCIETGPSHIFVGRHPDAHKYILAGIVEISAEAVAAHYFRRRESTHKWYWRMLWNLPQSLSLFEHARAAQHNAAINW